MAILAFQKPEKVIMLEADAFQGKFEFRPLEPGYGITIGNALRRILLSSLEGFAITAIKIEGVDHEYSTIPGVIDDVTNIILNLKQVRFKQIVEDIENEKVTQKTELHIVIAMQKSTARPSWIRVVACCMDRISRPQRKVLPTPFVTEV